MPKGKLHRIVLTGGPCAGKTSVLAPAREHLEKLGVKTFIVPEVATLAIGGGIRFQDIDEDNIGEIQRGLMELQVKLEDTFIRPAQQACDAGFNCVVISDRGALDYKAYMHEPLWKSLLDDNAWSLIGLRDRRYDAVIHMTTAASGAEDFYTLENNSARTETAEIARELDRRILSAWLGHPHLQVVNNATDFKTKITRVLQALSRVVGIPEPLEIERKFLVRQILEKTPSQCHVDRCDITNIEQIYLSKGHRIRQRGADGHYAYTQTIKEEIRPGVRTENEWMIAAREYFRLRRQVRPLLQFAPQEIIPLIEKTREVFLWHDQVFELDRYINPCKGLVLLECETATEQTPIDLPPFILITKDVTDDEWYSNYSIATNRAVPLIPIRS